MKLYGYYRSSASYRIRIVLNIKGVDWEYVPVALDKGEQRETSHRERNPMQLVPVLDTGDALLAQSVAIAEFLDTRYPVPPLLPADDVQRAQVREMQHIISSDVQPIGNLRVMQYVRDNFAQDDEGLAAWNREWIGRGFGAFEARAAERSTTGRFAFGDALTVADIWLVPQVYNADRFALDMTPYPTIRSVMQHLESIDAVADAHPSRQPDAPNAQVT